jgi:curved DNA-binding protein CbpA
VSASGGAGLFSALGLPARADLTDDDVRAAWRRLAAATHPDRADGGDPARFAVAAAAYTVLRTRSGRGEALGDLAEAGRPPGRRDAGPGAAGAGAAGAGAAGAGAAGAGAAGAGDAGRPARRMPAPPGTRSPTGRRMGQPYGLAGTRLQRVRRGRPVRLLLRGLIAVAIGAAAAAAAGLQPATPALWIGILTWFVLTARHDLAPPG